MKNTRPDSRHSKIIDALARAGFTVQLVTVAGRPLQRGIVRSQAVSHAA